MFVSSPFHRRREQQPFCLVGPLLLVEIERESMAATEVRPGRITSSDHGAAGVLAAAIMLGIAGLMLGMRLFQRWPWTRLFKIEDSFLIAATVRTSHSRAILGI